MIKLAMEIPTAYLQTWTAWTDLDFVLAHRVLEDPVYARFYAERSASRELILDNSMHELGHPLPVSDLVAAAKLVAADYVIPPDRLGEPETNLSWYLDARDAFAGTSHKVGAVLCGRTFDERFMYLQEVRDAPMLLLPFREPRLDWFFEQKSQIQRFPRIHLLGVNELVELWNFNQVAGANWSVDTAKPIKWGIERQLISERTSLRGAPMKSKDLLDVYGLSTQQILHITENVSYLRRFIA